MHNLSKVKDFILKNNILKFNNINKIIVGLSGGPDSVFLINMLTQLSVDLNLQLIAAHLDHEWRDNSSDDVIFCRQLCKDLNIKFVSEKLSNIKLNRKASNSKEEFARDIRRQFFEELLVKYQADFIALGHNFDDQIETFLIRLIRGTSMSGLSCIKAVNNFYIRPILDIKKSEILEYLKINNIFYLHDNTNDQDLYLRNRIRKYIVPNLRFCDNRFDLNFKKSLTNIQDVETFIDNLAKNLLFNIVLKEHDILVLDKKKFIELDKDYNQLYHKIILLWLCYHKVKFTPSTLFFNEILKFIKYSNSKTHMIHKNWYLLREKNLIKIVKVLI